MTIDYDELRIKFDAISNSIKSDLVSHKKYNEDLSKNTAIAILYIQNEANSLREYVKTRSYSNKQDAVYNKIEYHIGKVDEKIVRKHIRKELRYYSNDEVAIGAILIFTTLFIFGFVFVLLGCK